MNSLALQISFALTLFCTGVAWVIQTIVYPMLANMGKPNFADTFMHYLRSLTVAVYVPMQISFLATLAMIWFRPAAISLIFVGVLLALDVVILVSTFRRLAPKHYHLAKDDYDKEVIEQLAQFSWLRTICWTIKSVLLIALLSLLLN